MESWGSKIFNKLIYSTVTDLAKFLGLSTLHPRSSAIFKDNNCSSITSFVEDSEFEKICDKKNFVEQIYHNKLKWYHLPIKDLGAPNTEFKFKWETTKVLLKNELIEGKNIVLHCRGGKGRAGTVAALLLIDFGVKKEEAIQLVRSRRKGAIETKEQEEFIFSYRPVA